MEYDDNVFDFGDPSQYKVHILNTYIDNIYVLYISPFELPRIKRILDKKNIQAEFFLGTNGISELYDQFQDYTIKRKYDREHIKTNGAFGHIHSFIQIITDAIKNNYKKILILEPDVYFSKQFDKLIEEYLKMDYKLLYLGASQHNWKNIIISNKMYKANNTCGTFGIVIDNSIFDEYLELLKQLKCPSDICLFKIQEKYNNCFVTYPNLLCCDVTKSSTSGKRHQLAMAEKFKWFNNMYVYENDYQFKVDRNKNYKICFYVNSLLTNGCFVVKEMDIDKTDKIYFNNFIYDNKIGCHVYNYHTQTDLITIETNNAFFDDIKLKILKDL